MKKGGDRQARIENSEPPGHNVLSGPLHTHVHNQGFKI